MLGNRTSAEWVAEYSKSHTHTVNRFCHTLGIPMIAASVPFALASPFVPGLWKLPVGLFVVGWTFQFVGHAFERKPPEFLKDWRFLFVGLRWWVAKVAGPGLASFSAVPRERM
jgi:uncharacterized membrane protein YGL010W